MLQFIGKFKSLEVERRNIQTPRSTISCRRRTSLLQCNFSGTNWSQPFNRHLFEVLTFSFDTGFYTESSPKLLHKLLMSKNFLILQLVYLPQLLATEEIFKAVETSKLKFTLPNRSKHNIFF